VLEGSQGPFESLGTCFLPSFSSHTAKYRKFKERKPNIYGTRYFRFSGSCAPGLVHSPMLGQTWLGLEDEIFFHFEYACFSLPYFEQFLEHAVKKESKQRKETHAYSK
jgi:hypothetical protein